MDKVSICVIYYSRSGHTEKLVESIMEGLAHVNGVQPILLNVETLIDQDWTTLNKADGMIFAAPTFMGSIAAPFKAFMDKSGEYWLDQPWIDKIAAGATIGSSPSGDKLSALQQLCVFAAQYGMIWVGQSELGSLYTGDGKQINDCGSYLGLMATSDRNKSSLIRPCDAETARLFGQRIGNATVRWKRCQSNSLLF